MTTFEIDSINVELRALRARVDRLTWVVIAMLSATGFEVLRPLAGL